MATKGKKQGASSSARFWSKNVAKRLAAQGKSPALMTPALYPVLSAEVQFKERSRERIGDLELTLLSLVGLGVSSNAAMSKLTGLAEPRVQNFMGEFSQRGLVESLGGSGYAMTPLGTLTVESKALTTRSRRSMLLCGVTGRLMPASAYDQPFIDFSGLREGRYLPPFAIMEKSEVSLQYLDMEKVANPKAVNLPDEAIEIEGVDATTIVPGFLEVVAVVGQEESGAPFAEVHLPGSGVPIDWLDHEQVVGFLEPLGYRMKLTVAQVLDVIKGRFQADGFDVSNVRVDRLGNPIVDLISPTQEQLAKRIFDERLCFQIGTSERSALPVERLWENPKVPGGRSGRELLSGRVLRIEVLPDSSADRMASQMMALCGLEKQLGRSRSRDEADGGALALIHERLEELGLAVAEAASMAGSLGLRRLTSEMEDSAT